jgi:hypothetical protein
MRKAEAGVHPVQERRAIEAAEASAEVERRHNTVAALLARYLDGHGKRRWRRDTLSEISRCFKVDVERVIGAKQIGDVERRDRHLPSPRRGCCLR